MHRDHRPHFDETPGPTQARCRSSRTCTAPSASATRATATRRPGTCPPQRHPGGLCDEGHMVRLLRGQGGRVLRRRVGRRLRHLPVPEPQPGVDDLVPRPRARDDAPQRLRRAGGLLHRPRRTGRRQGGRSTRGRASPAVLPGPGAARGRQVPAEQAVSRDPDRDPGPRVQQRRVALLPGLARVLRRNRRPLHRRPGRDARGVLPDLEPRVLREHDHGQRQHMAVPERRAAALPVPVPQRVPVALPRSSTSRTFRGSRCGRSATRAGSSQSR